MVISSPVFLFLFLPIVFGANLLIKPRYSNALLALASLVFYAWGEPLLVLLLMLSILVNWLLGRGMARGGGKARALLLFIAVAFDLGVLGYYKYAGFLVNTLNGLLGRAVLTAPAVRLPVGISFFTFQAISFAVDVYREKACEAPGLVDTALYIAFFPRLVSGPIVRYKDFKGQLTGREITWTRVSEGFRRFIYGLSKKMLISSALGLCADTVFGYDLAALDARAAWIGAIAYALQLYYDFSGYSDMAIGLGRMFGFDLTENFDYPYLSRSIAEFWRRWHISLGAWFREYVYIPLGGNRKGTVRTYLNLCVVFFLTGLWHGAAWSFVVWGMYHGLFSVIERLGLGRLLKKNSFVATVYCLLVVVLGWVLFRANGLRAGLGYLSRMLMPWRGPAAMIPMWDYMDARTVAMAVCAVVGMGTLKLVVPQKLASAWKGSALEAIYCVALLILSLAAIASNTYNPFIYFQF